MMQDVIYDVNVSIDGFIAGSGGDISMFPSEGPMIDAYLDRLAEYRVAIMGRATYEFGYRFGLKPGANPYPHMRTIVFSRTLDLPSGAEIEVVRQDSVQSVARLREGDEGPIYLCGGGVFEPRSSRPPLSTGCGSSARRCSSEAALGSSPRKPLRGARPSWERSWRGTTLRATHLVDPEGIHARSTLTLESDWTGARLIAPILRWALRAENRALRRACEAATRLVPERP
jgi:hypothetical protein